MKQYQVTLTLEYVVVVDAVDEDDAIDAAYDILEDENIFDLEWMEEAWMIDDYEDIQDAWLDEDYDLV